MAPMTPDDLARLLDDLGQRLGPTGQYVFDITVRRVIAEAIVALVICATLTVVAWIAVVIAKRIGARDDWYSIGMAAVTVTALALLIGAMAAVALLNPEYAAMARIIELVKP